jgi:hypothetical protein
MKKSLSIVLAAALSLLVFSATAGARALVTEGSSELALSGMLDFQSESGTQSALNLRYGYFVVDSFSIGGIAGFSDNDYYTNIHLAFSGEYNFLFSDDYRAIVGTDFVPFIGIGLGLQYADSYRDDNIAAVVSPEAGVKFFLSDDFAVTASVLGQFASEEIYMNKRKVSSSDVSLQLGMRFYF